MKKYNTPVLLNLVSWARSCAVAIVLITSLAHVGAAGTIGISGGTLIVGTEPGDGNQAISASVMATDLLISGTNFDIVTPGCTLLASLSVACPLGGFNELVVLGGEGDDVINMSAITAPTFDITILGGPGADVLIGSSGDDTIFGGPGDDVLIGGPGNDCLNPGSGNNVVLQATRGGCFDGPDPVIDPLPRATAAPEPGGLFLMATAFGALPIFMRKLQCRQRTAKPVVASKPATPSEPQKPWGVYKSCCGRP